MKAEYIYMTVIAPLSIAVPVVIALGRYRLLTKEGRVFLCFLFFDALVSIVSSMLAFNHITNTPLFHIATVIATIILLYFFSMVFYEKNFKKYILLLAIIFPLLGLINALFFQQLFEFNSYTLSLQSIIVIALCFMYWWHHENDAAKPWQVFPLHWIISGLLLYFSSAFILFTFSNIGMVYFSKSTFKLVWNIHATLIIIMHILVSIGFSKYKA